MNPMLARPALNKPLKWHGGKEFLAPRIIALMPPHLHYVEPFAGGLSVLLRKSPEGVSEVVNDLDGALTNFWRVLQSPEYFPALQRRLEATPFSANEWRAARRPRLRPCPVERAAAFFIECRQSLAGRRRCFAPLSRARVRRGMNEQTSSWLTAIEGLPAVHERLKRVVILNEDALNVIRREDGPQTLFYLDPPYLAATRAEPNVYAVEMGDGAHAAMLDAVRQCRGRVILSGYDNPQYARALAGWRRIAWELPNHSAGGETKRLMTECVWLNYEPGQTREIPRLSLKRPQPAV